MRTRLRRGDLGVVQIAPSPPIGSEANRTTPWGESHHPPVSTGANRSSAGALLPDSCANFPIRARFGVWHGMCIYFLT